MRVERKIKNFIKSLKVCTLATCKNNRPRASTVNYVSEGFTLYIRTSRKSTKVRNIKANPRVSVAIDDCGKTRLCIQAEGIARILGKEEAEKVVNRYFKKGRKHKKELVDTIIRIDLKRIMFSDYTTKKLKVYKFKVKNNRLLLTSIKVI